MEAGSCRRIADDWIDREDGATSERNRYGSLDAKSFSVAFGPATESATERARLLQTWFLYRKDDARPGCPRGRSYAPRSYSRSSHIVPNSQGSRRCFDPPT